MSFHGRVAGRLSRHVAMPRCYATFVCRVRHDIMPLLTFSRHCLSLADVAITPAPRHCAAMSGAVTPLTLDAGALYAAAALL